MRHKAINVHAAKDKIGAPTVKAVYRLVDRRKIPFHRRGRRLLFFEDELDEFLDALPGVTPSEALARQ